MMTRVPHVWMIELFDEDGWGPVYTFASPYDVDVFRTRKDADEVKRKLTRECKYPQLRFRVARYERRDTK
jgi:hypothetical protein